MGSAEQGIPGPQRVEAPRGEPSAPRGLCPSPPAPRPFPPPPRLLCVAVKRPSINPVWSGARAQGLFVQWLEVQKSALSRGRRLQLFPFPAGAPAPTPALVRPRLALPGEEGARLLPAPGPARAASRPRSPRPRTRQETRARPLRRQDGSLGASPEHGAGRECAEPLGRLSQVGAGTQGLLFDRTASGCGRPRAWPAGGPRNPSAVWHPAPGSGRQGARALWEEREQPPVRPGPQL